MQQLQHIALLPGDGIGPEVVAEAVKVLKAVSEKYNLDFQFEEGRIGAIAIDETGDPFPPATQTLCERADAILLGAVGDPKFDNDPNIKVRPEQGLLRMRKSLGLFANVRPTVMYKELADFSPLKKERLEGVDLVVYRELTSGIYFGDKALAADGNSATDECYYEVAEVERIAHLAFQAAQKRRKQVCLVDKANVLETSRLWRRVVQGMAANYPDVEVKYMFVDNAAMQMIIWPAQFDVILTSNMFGDIISDEASVLSGSMGLLPSASLGDANVLFEPIHGSYPQAAGKNIANPMATILSAAMMLRQFNLDDAATSIETAVERCIQQGHVTQDLNKEQYLGTSGVGDKVVENL